MKASVFIGTSLDGFIARANGDSRFPPARRWRTPRLRRVHGHGGCAGHRPQDVRDGLDL